MGRENGMSENLLEEPLDVSLGGKLCVKLSDGTLETLRRVAEVADVLGIVLLASRDAEAEIPLYVDKFRELLIPFIHPPLN